MGSLVLTGDTSGSVTVAVPAVAGSNTATIGAATGTHYPFTAGSAVTCAGQTSIDFTNIPSWVKRITVMFNGVSLSGTDKFLIQVGTGSTPATSGYNSAATSVSVSTSNATNGSASNTTNGFTLNGYTSTAASLAYGQFVLTKVSGNIWAGAGNLYSTGALRTCTVIGGVDLSSSALEMVRVTTINGTDTFDTTPSAGSINILYE